MMLPDDSELAQRDAENLALDDELKILRQEFMTLLDVAKSKDNEIAELREKMQSAANELDAIGVWMFHDEYYYAVGDVEVIKKRLRGEED